MAARAGRRFRGRPGKFLQGLVDELIAFAEAEFRLARVAPDGSTEREHAESAARQWAKLGKVPKVKPLANGQEFPVVLDYLWSWFVEISHGLETGGFGPAGVTWVGLRAWVDLTGRALEPWEAMALVRLGGLRASIMSEKSPQTDK